VDAVAQVPQGTTSRYFRTREALLTGAAERLGEQIVSTVDAVEAGESDPERLPDSLTELLYRFLADRPILLALWELDLEANRRPAITDAMARITTVRRDLVLRRCRTAGVELSAEDALLMVMIVNGIMFTAMTSSPEAVPRMGALISGSVRAVLERYRS